ncbi:MAG TPA: DEAD/DEAH box helicase family protein [Chloroflexia bacterium]|jgi:type I restriction enzyme R subunit
MDITERALEDQIESHLVQVHGYRKRAQDHYSKADCLDWGLVLEFITTTQPDAWRDLVRQHGTAAEEKFRKRLTQEIERRGTLDVLRRGVKDYGCYFHLAYFAPASSLNTEHTALYSKNILSVLRQCSYSTHTRGELDLVLFLNGLPFATAELKNHLTGQTFEQAKEQYKKDRNPRGELLLAFKRCLVHFAVDDDQVYMTTRLAGSDTRFLPFNRGHANDAGNPPNPQGYASSYLWEEVLSPASVLELVGSFAHVQATERDGKKSEDLIFPRYHQRDAVRSLVAHARQHGPGQQYLIQHSAGSGKSNSIAWLAHRLSTLHDSHDARVFDSVVIITDRRILDRQLQDTVKQFEQTPGVVRVIDKDSAQLAQALEDGDDIVVTTLQKFPFVVGKIGALKGHRFAVIVDEAHSSQTGESTKSLKQVLSAATLEEAEQLDSEEIPTGEDLINRSMQARGSQPNLSFFAFTATPKQKTLETFGTRHGSAYAPFHHYSMRQAIEEQFILDVLQNYTNYDTYFNLLKTVESDPRYEKTRTVTLLRRYVDLHEHTIALKTALMVEHFLANTMHRIPDDKGHGQAKAMLVTRSRLHAVLFKQAFDAYLRTRNLPIKALVAFSGAVDHDGLEYTEPQMNGFPDTQTASTFNMPEYRFLIAAEKFQTGFDQPLLHTMYVDKVLSGVAAVQTLSRLNRTHHRKTETMVLDFGNTAEDIQQAFQPYYETTILSEGTDPNRLYDLQRSLDDFRLYTESQVAEVAEIFLRQGEKAARLQPLLMSVVSEYRKIEDGKQRAAFKHHLRQYVRHYAFLSQVIPFKDRDLERLYLFARLLLYKLPTENEQLPSDVLDKVDLETYRIQQLSSGGISLTNGNGSLDPLADLEAAALAQSEQASLSQIIKDINERFGTSFTEADRVFFAELKTRLAANESLQASARINVPDNVRLLHDAIFGQVLHSMIENNFDMFKRINDDPAFGDAIRAAVFDQVYKDLTRQAE